jgi:hypothetical protein
MIAASKSTVAYTPITLPAMRMGRLVGVMSRRASVPSSRSSRKPPAVPIPMNSMNMSVKPIEYCWNPLAPVPAPRTFAVWTASSRTASGGLGDQSRSA